MKRIEDIAKEIMQIREKAEQKESDLLMQAEKLGPFREGNTVADVWGHHYVIDAVDCYYADGSIYMYFLGRRILKSGKLSTKRNYLINPKRLVK